MATLTLKNINKIYANNVQAVFDFNLEIKDKEFIVLVGPSGCGKSTTLRMIAGLEDITFGELTIDGQIMNTVEPKNRHIAMVFQNYALYPHMTVYQNMAFALKLRKRNMIVYETNPEIDQLNLQMDELYKKIAKVDKKYKKDQNNKNLLEEHISLYKEVFALEDQIEKLKKPILGLNQCRINELEQKIKEFLKEVDNLKKQIQKKKNFANGELEALNEGIYQREKLIEKIQLDIDDIRNHDYPIEKSRHLTKREMDIEIQKVAESIDLTRYLFRKPAALSGGQRQRVALGRAIVRKPKVFLMDEPLSNLDAKLRVQTRSEISKLHKRVGATTIYVTHDQTEAMTMADRIVIMKDGYIQQVGTPNDVYNDPANKFVAGFIGSPSMNFLDGKINGDKFVPFGTTSEIVVGKALIDSLKNRDLIMGIRPEDIYLKGDRNNEHASAAIKVVVTYVELLGSSLIVYANFGSQKLIFETDADEKIKVDDEVEICLDRSKMYFFGKEDEKRIK